MSSCSTPHNSGNSESIVLPPSAARISAVCPMAGFGERPEKPSGPPLAQLRPQNSDLRMLAAQAEHRRAGHIRVMDVARDQSTKIVGIFPGSSAAPFVQQKPDAVQVFENSGTLRARRVSRPRVGLD